MKIDIKKFEQALTKKGLTKSQLSQQAGISSRTIAKIGKREDLQNIVVEKICQFLCINKDELVQQNKILAMLRDEKEHKVKNGFYHAVQIKLTYNSNHIEGSRLTEEQTRNIFETKTVGDISNYKVDDIIETQNHFKCIDYVIDHAEEELCEQFIKHLHYLLKMATSDNEVGQYKSRANTVGGIETVSPKQVECKIKRLLKLYNSKESHSLEEVVQFHYEFEVIHPFEDGNGRIGRLIAFKECLKNNLTPFYIDDNNKFFYYNGLARWKEERGYLLDTCRFGQDMFEQIFNYFNVEK